MTSDTVSATADHPTFDIEAIVSADVLIDKLRALGATVVWCGTKPSQETMVEIEVTIDAADAWELLPGDWTEDEEPDQPAWRDVGDFIDACASGDRSIALALLPRLCLSADNASIGERVLERMGQRLQ